MYGMIFGKEVSSPSNQLIFKPSGTGSMTLTHQGLGVCLSSPSSNLHVSGNAVVSNALSINSNFVHDINISGTMAIDPISYTSDVTIGASAMNVVDSSAGNVTLTLPTPTAVEGEIYVIKKTSTNHVVTVTAGSNLIESKISMKLIANSLSHLELMAASGNWHILEQQNIALGD